MGGIAGQESRGHPGLVYSALGSASRGFCQLSCHLVWVAMIGRLAWTCSALNGHCVSTGRRRGLLWPQVGSALAELQDPSRADYMSKKICRLRTPTHSESRNSGGTNTYDVAPCLSSPRPASHRPPCLLTKSESQRSPWPCEEMSAFRQGQPVGKSRTTTSLCPPEAQ